MARKKVSDEERLYHVYVTDALMAAYHLDMRYYDVISPAPHVEERSAEEIIENIVSKIEELQ